MRFVLTIEQEEMQGVARRLFDRELPLERAVENADRGGPYDSLWQGLGSELGVGALLVSEAFDGLGASFVELALVAEEAGRALSGAPLVSTAALGASLLADVEESDVVTGLLRGIADGSRIVAVAQSETEAPWAADQVRSCATYDDGRWRVRGEKTFVIDGADADVLLVFARDGDDLGLFVTETGEGVSRRPVVTLDHTRRFADVVFAEAPATRVATGAKARALAQKALDLGAVMMVLDSVGGMRRCLEIAVDHAKNRQQFGVPIGSFQAVKHKCADMALLVESASSVAREAAWLLSAGHDPADVTSTVRLAKAYCTEAYSRVAGETIQILGGIGFTWEHPAHLFFKRAKANELLFGSPSVQRWALAESLGLTAQKTLAGAAS